MSKKDVLTPQAPAPIGPYSQAIEVRAPKGFLFCSGQIPIDPADGTIKAQTVEDQTQQVLKNLGAVLLAGGSSFEGVVKTTIFLKNMADFPKVNEVYGKYFTGITPARSTVEVARLPKDVLVEIEAIALTS